MAQYEGSSYAAGTTSTTGQPTRIEEIGGWTLGFTAFATVMLLMLGFFHFIEGLAAVIDDTFYVVRPNFALEVDTTTWGWVNMIGGVIMGLAGLFLMTGNILARIVTILVAVISVLWNFYSIPYYPVWSILMIAVGIGVIFAVTAYPSSREVERYM